MNSTILSFKIQADMAKYKLATAPCESWFIGNMNQFRRDPLGFLDEVAKMGDVVKIRFVVLPTFVINHPDLIKDVLTGQGKKFRKAFNYRTPFMKRLFGKGLLLAEGSFWQKQRKLAQPAFHRKRLDTYLDVMVRQAEQTMQDWKNGEARPIHIDMMRMTRDIITICLLNTEGNQGVQGFERNLTVLLNQFILQFTGVGFLIPWLPTTEGFRFRRATRELDDFIYKTITDRRASQREGDDLLWMLMQVEDEEGERMSDQQLRDELVTLMLAGLDTSSLGLAWTCLLLAKNPEVQDKLHQEVVSVLGDRMPELEDIPRLKYLNYVLKEGMRIYPPVWAFARAATENLEIGGQKIRKGQTIWIGQWMAHRDPRYFVEPEVFNPDRWASPEMEDLPKYAYLPFSGGPRGCIGESFAMMEMVLALAIFSRKWRFKAPADYQVTPLPSITLHPKEGIHLTVEQI